MKHRQPLVGEVWTMQCCEVHGCPDPLPIDWHTFPMCVSTVVAKVEPYYAELVSCGCMQKGKLSPKIHDPRRVPSGS